MRPPSLELWHCGVHHYAHSYLTDDKPEPRVAVHLPESLFVPQQQGALRTQWAKILQHLPIPQERKQAALPSSPSYHVWSARHVPHLTSITRSLWYLRGRDQKPSECSHSVLRWLQHPAACCKTCHEAFKYSRDQGQVNLSPQSPAVINTSRCKSSDTLTLRRAHLPVG